MRRPGRGPRTLSIHTRLFLGFGSALGVCATLMVTIIYVGMRFLPTYDFSETVVVPDASSWPPFPAPTIEPPVAASPAPGLVPGRRAEHLGSISSKEDVWNTVLLVSTGGVLLVMVLGLGAGWLLSRRLLAPLHTISEAAAKAADGNLTERIDAQGPEDELRQLADTFDTMLARLEQSFTAHQRFAANASHELLTPLATTRAALQLAADDPTGAELAELAPMLRETNERNISVVRALLDLAGADQVAFDPAPVDLSDLAERSAATRSGQAAANGVRLDVDTESGCAVAGNATLLRQLLLNLLDNALTHNIHREGRVHLAVFRDGAKTVVEVENTGPQLVDTVVERLFEPFYRSHSRVGSDRAGHGLGLAIVRSITTAHHGTVTAAANPAGGLTVRVEFPAPHRITEGPAATP
ncbi:sensor histidine kinase [Streptomyces sp. NBC_01257]|uniref:sensor histidine kinase n=1 Tax=Streptomyces sp. NBC_01257 TaxID=2903799 RepID=UPI002DD9E1A6|nr:HAMP domain-containing sensor histidine kinase [Streptomyces sp. NBC_01257]WRZ62742.1 HAMP domain-containing histidine kinase [Streptomyces sp. NBC_01257]